jgi:hypothetical protein
MNLEHCVAVLERAGIKFESGLSAAELGPLDSMWRGKYLKCPRCA